VVTTVSRTPEGKAIPTWPPICSNATDDDGGHEAGVAMGGGRGSGAIAVASSTSANYGRTAGFIPVNSFDIACRRQVEI